ncbi:MAG: hypothetical protein MUC34_15620 [Anaerolineae bacterium]|nr:hypothetical protein [Anaerolineae bacterium]
MSRRRYLAVALMALALILVTMGAVSADLKPTAILNSFDDGSGKYENGNITMWLNNSPQPFYTGIDFDNDTHLDACGPGTSTKWAGDTFVSLYHEDNNPQGAPGFQSTVPGSWKIVKCSAFDAAGYKYAQPADTLATCDEAGSPAIGKSCVLRGSKDTLVVYNSGNRYSEIETSFHLTVDTNCDGTVDEPFASNLNDLCLYWEAVKPPKTPANQAWGGNIQVRYRADNDTSGGDKTINFNELLGPNAVSMASLGAVAEANSASLAMWAGAMGLAAAALWLWRKRSAG